MVQTELGAIGLMICADVILSPSSWAVSVDHNNVEEPYGENADTILYMDIKAEPRPGQGTTWHDYWKKQEDPSQSELF